MPAPWIAVLAGLKLPQPVVGGSDFLDSEGASVPGSLPARPKVINEAQFADAGLGD